MSSLGTEVSTFIHTVEGDIIAVGEAAWAQTKAELQTLGEEMLALVKADIQTVISNLPSTTSIEDIETELLNLWSQNKSQVISALSSGAIQLLIALGKTAVAAL